jgi:hypothetical protein
MKLLLRFTALCGDKGKGGHKISVAMNTEDVYGRMGCEIRKG